MYFSGRHDSSTTTVWKRRLIVGHRYPYFIRRFYDSLSCRPRPVESIRLKGASASVVMVGCRIDGVEVDLRDGHVNYSMTMYVADIADNCILDLDYLKAREAVIELSPAVLQTQ